MPIKSCSRCGLKVLVDATQAANDNYLCPRCAPDVKSAPAPKPAGGGKRPSVKVTCPYCGAAFSGSIPSRPAKGGCPVCQKELVLLPDGTIQAAATFNIQAWQKDREGKKSASNPPPAPAPVAAPYEAPPELPSTPDPLGGSTILDMGGPPGSAPPPPPSTIDDQTMAIPGGLGDQTMLGMGSGAGELPPPPPTLEEETPEPAPELPRAGEPEAPPDLGGATILDMGPGPVELAPSIEDSPPPSDLLSDMMPGMDRPPSAESPVEPPVPPPIPEERPPEPEAMPEPDATEVPTIREADAPPPEEPAPIPVSEEPYPESIESAPEIPGDLGGQTILDMGGTAAESRHPQPSPSIEEPPPEAVPILAKDVGSPESSAPDAPAGSEGEATAKPYIYQPIPRVPRQAPPPPPEPAPVARESRGGLSSSPSNPPPPPSSGGVPVLGSDFRMAPPPPEPSPSLARAHEEHKPTGPKTSAVVLPRAQHSLKLLVFAWFLLLLPIGAGYALHSMKKHPTVEKVIQRLRDEVKPGIDKMDREMRKAIAPPAEAPPKAPESK